jgi:hypothetical protein
MRWLPTDNTTSTTAAGVYVVEAVCATATATRDDEVIDLRPSDRREGAATSSPPENLTKLPIERDVLGDRRAAGRGGDLRRATTTTAGRRAEEPGAQNLPGGARGDPSRVTTPEGRERAVEFSHG